MYEKMAPYYKCIFPSSEVQREFFRRLFEEHRVESVLDVACGTGEQLEASTSALTSRPILLFCEP